ncbi:MAG: TlpA family protein disulfide reductase [Dehalococcoidia bacterium]
MNRLSNSSKYTFYALVLIVLVISVLGCLSNQSRPSDVVSDFEYVLYDETNTSIKLSDSYGVPIILNFWAGLCPPCRAEMPDFQEFYDSYGHEIVVIGIDIGKYTGLGSKADALKLVDELGITYTIGGVEDDSVIELYSVYGLPHTLFIDGDQNLVRAWSGVINLSKLEDIGLGMLESSQ